MVWDTEEYGIYNGGSDMGYHMDSSSRNDSMLPERH